MPLKVFLQMNGFLITLYFVIGDIDFRFKGLHAPFRNIRPKSFVKYILYYKDKQRGMVNICFWAEIYIILIFILSNIGLFLIHQFNLGSTEKILLFEGKQNLIFQYRRLRAYKSS